VAFVTPLLGDLRGSFGVDQGPPLLSWGTFAPWFIPGLPQVWGARTASREPEILVPPIDFGIPTLPVEVPLPVFYPQTLPGLPPVLPGQVGGGRPNVRLPPSRPQTVPPPGKMDAATEVILSPVGGIWVEPGRRTGELDETPPEEPPMAHDWGHFARQGIGSLLGIEDPFANFLGGLNIASPGTDVTRPSGSAASLPSQAPLIMEPGTCDPCGNRRYVTLDRQTGKISCKRRRRRRLLTNRDLADLASLKTVTGGGAALNSAVIRAVR